MTDPQDRSEVGVFTIDRNLIIVSWDVWMAQASGIAEPEARGRSLLELFPDIETRGLAERLRAVLDAGTVDVLAPAFHHYLVRCPTSDGGGYFDVMQQHVTVSPLRERSRITGLVITVQDVTARTVRERRLAEHVQSAGGAIRSRAERPVTDAQTTSLVDALSDADWQVRRAAAHNLGAQSNQDAIARLVEIVRDQHTDLPTLNASLSALTLARRDSLPLMVGLLDHADANVRMYTALALGNMQDTRALPYLLNQLDDTDLNVRYHVIEALGRIGSVDAVEPLLRIVRERDHYLAFAALDALATIGEPSAMPEVIDLIDDPVLGSAAIDTLAAVGNEQAAAPLAAALTETPVPTVVCNALARIHDRLQQELGEGELVADLVRARLDPAAASRLVAQIPRATDQELPGVARVLGWVRVQGMEGVLCELLRHGPSRKNAQEALIAIGKPALPQLLGMLQDEVADVRQAAAAVLGQIGAHESVADLSARLPQEEPDVIVTIVAALGSIGSPAAFDALLPLLGHSNAAVRHAAVSAINSVAHPKTAARIAKLLSDRSSLVRECAVRIAGYFGYADCFERVLALLTDESAHVRRAVAEHLPYYDDARVMTGLARALRDTDVSVRAAAARSLAHLDAERAQPLVGEALRDTDGRVRYHAVQTVATQKLRGFAPVLRQLLAGDAAMPVRIASASALGELQDKDAADALQQAALHPEPDLACPALIALCRLPRVDAGAALEHALSSPDPRRQIAAVQAIAGGNQYLDQLKRLAESASHPQVIGAALKALVASGDREAIAAVVALSARDDLRAECTAALAQASEADVPLLAEALRHGDPRVRSAVVHALARMRRKPATRELSVALNDQDPTVRFAAAQALGRLDML